MLTSLGASTIRFDWTTNMQLSVHTGTNEPNTHKLVGHRTVLVGVVMNLLGSGAVQPE